MSIIKGVLIEERERLIEMEKMIKKRIEQLPKGSIRIRKLGKKEYRYFVYREGSKVKNQYLKLSDDEVEELQMKIAERKRLEQTLKSIQEDFRIIRRALR
ncbi:hypothetical protein GTO91_15985 [Heliobacterium undosum]|uniref:DUF6788 domain-containing protein n=1 Tax=Heliomicrobium undosum TaxID=121734 RepID=A0A845LC09_9FIRM|nr:hypothetical protein [Heliomicrobium undosum]MZP31208.1 hypothetical protein [Heliomicrobium undosum]